jgi:hypothetical protein
VTEPNEVDAAVERIETLLGEFERGIDPRARERAGELVSSVMRLYGEGLERAVRIIAGSPEMLEVFTGDRLLASLLLLHGLHPDSIETRVEKALGRIERRLDVHHLSFEGIEEGTARIRIEKNGGSSPWPPDALAAIIERAVMEAAPDVERVQIDGLETARPLVQIAPAPSA